jgi:hypothetical protein
MGAKAWDYFVPYEPDVQTALAKLREREFRAGRFRGSELSPATMEEAVTIMEPGGTASILDIDHVADEPELCAIAPLPKDELVRLFGTDKPTRAMVEANMDFFEHIERGQGVYIVAYHDDQPTEIYFGGYSFD